ncbi:taste receptor type 1 member 3 [Rhineura floridana]|uniref:taste receptor type 1 member 3 n=1 Tax=Rhineura floridana TaxID=261503 RepID=UPI002AC831D5|nr:taste receptor type 1 member 3 [Rhineura floridana]
MSAFLLLSVSLDWALAQDNHCMSSQFRKPGDYILGGLFPFTVLTTNETDRTLPDVYKCERLYAAGLVWALGMKFAIEEINNSTVLLPGITLGYDIYDSCMEPVVALQPSLLFLSRAGTNSIGVLCNYTDYQTRVMAVIGPHNSKLSIVTAKLFSFFLIPQVSYGATTEKLNDEEQYPSFFRTVPSDMSQLEAMIQLLKVYKWNWIAVVGSDDEYGREGLNLLSSMVANEEICIAFEGLIPADVSNPNLQKMMTQTIRSINETNVNVVILFANDRPVRAFFKLCFELGLNQKVWLATEAWVMSDVVTSLRNIQSIGTVIGFVIKGGKVPGFEEYIYRLLELTQQDGFCTASQEEGDKMGADVLGQQCLQCNSISHQNITTVLEHRQTFAVYTAVYCVAHALHDFLRCRRGFRCQKSSIKSWQLLDKLKAINFSLSNQTFQFDQHRSMNRGYEVITWSWQESSVRLTSLGDFKVKLNINTSLVQFHTEDRKAPRSECLTTCQPGQIRRMKGFHLCCYDCIDCERGTFSSSLEDTSCTPCPKEQWSPERSVQCYDRSEKYFFFSEPLAVVLLLVRIFAFTLICLSGALFLKHLHTPMVQATGGAMCLLGLFCLALICAGSSFFVGKPSLTFCLMQHPSYALCLNPCFSTIMVKALQIMLVNDFPNSRRTFLHTLIQRRPWAIVALCFLVESGLCFGYMYGNPPILHKNYELLPTKILIQCKIQSWVTFAVIHGYNCLLAVTSFLCTFMVQTSPKNYNVARGITFAMLTYFIALIFFIPTYATVRQEYQPAVQMATMSLCTVGLLGAYYLPKCYILLFKPEWNTADYFQDYTKERLQEKESQD